MSFRKFGGLQYSAKHNNVSSYNNTSTNLQATNIGQPQSYITLESGLIRNIHILGSLDVSGNVGIDGDVDVSGNLTTTQDALINSLTIGRGNGNINTNTAIGSGALTSNQTTGTDNTAVGYETLLQNRRLEHVLVLNLVLNLNLNLKNVTIHLPFPVSSY